MENNYYYDEITFDNERIKDWDFLDNEHFMFRLHYKPIENDGAYDLGFMFYITTWVSNKADFEEYTLGSETTVECMCYGYASFDGIRHLYWGDKQTNNRGYDYYPNIEEIKCVLSKLQELEDRYCHGK